MATEPYSKMIDILFGYDTDIHFENGELMLTTGIDFIERELLKVLTTLPGDWKADPTVGASPNAFTGDQNTRETAQQIERHIEENIRMVVAPAIPVVRAVPTNLDSIMIFIDLNLSNFQKVTIPFEFDYINGIQKFRKIDHRVTPIKSSSTIDINDISSMKRPNKYWSRMGYNATNQT